MAEIRSIDIVDFKYNLTNYINNQPLPMELKRMVVNDILMELNSQAQAEVYAQAQEREDEKNA